MRSIGLCLGTTIALTAAACSVSPGDSSETSSASATARAAVCSPEQQQLVLANMVQQPVRPPRFFAGLDLAGGDGWTGLKFEEMEQRLCQATPVSEDETTTTVSWGAAQEVVIGYSKTTKQLDNFQLNAGYRGTMDFKSRATALGDPTKPNPYGDHTYSIGVGRPILRDGQTFELNWSAPTWEKQATELFDAVMATFAPELQSTQESCIKAQTCLAKKFSTGEAIFGVRPLGIYLYVPDGAAPQPAASTPGYLYGFMVKTMPFSQAETFVKLDGEGPVAIAKNLGDRSPMASCTMKLDTTYQSFLQDCVQVVQSPEQNEFLKKKLLGGVAHTFGPKSGTWAFDVSGTHLNFGSADADKLEPQLNAVATELVIDIRSGKITNEYDANGALTLAATTAIYREYARLVQKALHERMNPLLTKYPLGAPECLLPEDLTGVDLTTWRPARGCTGMEQFITSDLRSQGIASVLKPGSTMSVFCADKAGEHCGYEGSLGLNMDSVWGGTHKQVLNTLGGGLLAQLPADARDPKFYFRIWATAYVKYLLTAGEQAPDLSLMTDPLPSDFVFETVGADAAAREKFRYLDKFGYEAFLTGSVMEIKFFR
jgi:hypothetical protein